MYLASTSWLREVNSEIENAAAESGDPQAKEKGEETGGKKRRYAFEAPASHKLKNRRRVLALFQTPCFRKGASMSIYTR